MIPKHTSQSHHSLVAIVSKFSDYNFRERLPVHVQGTRSEPMEKKSTELNTSTCTVCPAMFHPPLHFKSSLSTSLFTHSLPLTPSPPHTLSTSTSYPLHLTLPLPLHLTLSPPHSFTHSLPLTPFPLHTHTPSLPHTLTPFPLHILTLSLNAVEIETYLTSRKALFSLFSLSSVSRVFTAGREAAGGVRNRCVKRV